MELRRRSKRAGAGAGASARGSPPATTVREFRPGDAEAVRRICSAHFRSLNLPAVEYYLVEHFRDLIALVVIAKIFSTWREMFYSALLFLAYLFVRAFVELESYILRDCPDLRDISGHYNAPRCRFWVATIDRPAAGGGGGGAPAVVGCVGCCPARDDAKIAQLLRLVVREDARRMRVGSRLLAQFEMFARENGFREVRLYTNNLNTNHMKFIRQHGYEMVHCVSRSLMRGSLIQWRKELAAPEAVAAGGSAGGGGGPGAGASGGAPGAGGSAANVSGLRDEREPTTARASFGARNPTLLD